MEEIFIPVIQDQSRILAQTQEQILNSTFTGTFTFPGSYSAFKILFINVLSHQEVEKITPL